MCLYTDTDKALIAKEDIHVWKVITSKNLSIHQYFEYKPNTLYRLRKALKLVGIPSRIYEGFHSFRIKPYKDIPEYKVVEFTIPKGAKYFLGIHDDIVSTSIRSGTLRDIYD